MRQVNKKEPQNNVDKLEKNSEEDFIKEEENE